MTLENRKEAMKDWWTKWLCAVPKMTRDKAEAITQIYPSHVPLIAVYQNPQRSLDEKENLLKDIQPLGQERKLGPVLSKRIYQIMTTMDGGQVVT